MDIANKKQAIDALEKDWQTLNSLAHQEDAKAFLSCVESMGSTSHLVMLLEYVSKEDVPSDIKEIVQSALTQIMEADPYNGMLGFARYIKTIRSEDAFKENWDYLDDIAVLVDNLLSSEEYQNMTTSLQSLMEHSDENALFLQQLKRMESTMRHIDA